MNLEDFQHEWIKHHAVGIQLKYDGNGPAKPRRMKSGAAARALKKEARRRMPFEAVVDEELDLHGLSVDQAVLETELFIDLARRYGLSAVRIIHGIGPDKGTSLRSEVRRFLKQKCMNKIDRFVIEPHNDGAVIIYPKPGKA